MNANFKIECADDTICLDLTLPWSISIREDDAPRYSTIEYVMYIDIGMGEEEVQTIMYGDLEGLRSVKARLSAEIEKTWVTGAARDVLGLIGWLAPALPAGCHWPNSQVEDADGDVFRRDCAWYYSAEATYPYYAGTIKTRFGPFKSREEALEALAVTKAEIAEAQEAKA